MRKNKNIVLTGYTFFIVHLVILSFYSGAGAKLPATAPEVFNNVETAVIAGAPDANETNEITKPTFICEPIPENIKAYITGKSYKQDTPFDFDQLSYLTVTYYNFNEEICVGNIIVAHSLGDEVLEIFQELYEKKYPIDKIQLIDDYDADDNRSMADNNTSAFNFRFIQNTNKVSNHGYGKAIDINPLQNPYVLQNTVQPSAGAQYLDRSMAQQGMIIKGDDCYNAFVSRGWQWGGDWTSPKDYQHFEKP